MNRKDLEEYIIESLKALDEAEQENRFDIMTLPLKNKTIDSDPTLFELFETEKSMTNEQIVALNNLKRKLINIDQKDEEWFINIINIIKIVCRNTEIETYYITTTELISNLSIASETHYMFIKKYIDYILGSDPNIDTSSRISLIESLIKENESRKEDFYSNHQKIKKRKEIKDE